MEVQILLNPIGTLRNIVDRLRESGIDGCGGFQERQSETELMVSSLASALQIRTHWKPQLIIHEHYDSPLEQTLRMCATARR